MLTLETLKQNSALAGLNDAQLNAIAEMSKNDENTVIATKIGALHGQYDTDIFTASGIKKNDGEKSYDYAKRVIEEYKTKVASTESLQNQLNNAKSQITELQSKIEAGKGNETLTQQLKDANARVTQLQSELTSKTSELTAKQTEYEKTLKDIHVDYAFQAATAGLKFKAGISEDLQKTILTAAKSDVLAKGTPDLIDEQGKKQLVFRDAQGNILNNPKNNLNPYTLQELLMITALKDALETDKTQPGGGTGSPTSEESTSLDLSGIKTQIEADKAIEGYLLANGITRDSQEFADKSLQLRTENKISELPIR